MSFKFPTETLKEGKARLIVPKLDAFVKEPWEYAPSKAPVFYNPAMELNRNLAVATLQVYQKNVKREIVACEPLAGCGVRGVRLAIEVEGAHRIFMNDISSKAAELAEFNVKLNNLSDKVTVANEDANLLLSRFAAPRRRFDYVDIDPFGSPVPYIDSALRALRNGGLLALTATDMAPLCGVHPKACVRRYGARPLRTEYCHELAVRILIGCLASMAAKRDMEVCPIFSYSMYNHVRTYATVSYGAKKADKSVESLGYILHCFSCFHRESQAGIDKILKKSLDCPECGSKLHLTGPLWLGSLWDIGFCQKIIDQVDETSLRNAGKIRNILSLIIGEAKGPVTYYVVDRICDKFNLPIPPLSKIVQELGGSGFEGVRTHFNTKALRTDASAIFLTQIIKRLSG